MKRWWSRILNWIDRNLKENVEQRSGRWAPRLYRIPFLAPALLVATVLLAWTAFVVLARLSGYPVAWWHPRIGSIPAENRGDLVRDTLAFIALIGAVLAAIYAYRKQRIEEAAGYRADAESLSKRYQDAAEQLGHDAAAVRLAGVYSMARLADDWPEQRQTCVDVLCAYLRMPIADEDKAEIQVRTAIVKLIDAHVTRTTRRMLPVALSWSELSFDFSGAPLKDFSLEAPNFEKTVTFDGAQFSGRSRIWGGDFGQGISFNEVTVRGALEIERTALGLGFTGTRLAISPEGDLRIAITWAEISPRLSLSKINVEGRLHIWVNEGAEFQLEIDSLRAYGNAVVSVEMAEFKVAPRFTEWRIDDAAEVRLPEVPGLRDEEWVVQAVQNGAHLVFEQ